MKVDGEGPASFRVYGDKKRLRLQIILSTIIVAICLWLAWAAITTPKFDASPIGVRILPAGMCLMIAMIMTMPLRHALKRIQRKDPEIIVNDEGIYAWHWSDAIIPWSNIGLVLEHHMSGAKMLSLKLSNPELNPPRKRKNILFDKNRELADWMQGKLQNPIVKSASALIAPGVAHSLRISKAAPDHRDPIMHVAGTDRKLDDLLAAIGERMNKTV